MSFSLMFVLILSKNNPFHFPNLTMYQFQKKKMNINILFLLEFGNYFVFAIVSTINQLLFASIKFKFEYINIYTYQIILINLSI